MSLDDEIDLLYQAGLEEFTAVRNDLARRAGTRAAEVKQLRKPSAAAWAINQLFWRRRAVFDTLARASESRRAAHVRQLDKGTGGVDVADARHRAALEAATDVAMSFLRGAEAAPSPATVDAVTRTLEAIPTPEVNGRLTRPLEAVGFSMLASLMSQVPAGKSRPRAEVVPMKPRRERDEETRRVAQERKHAQERLKKELAAVVAREAEVAATLAKARQAAERARDRVEQLDAELSSARKALDESRAAVERARSAINEVTAARMSIERKISGT